MLETATQGTLHTQYQCAHALRAQAFRAAVVWLRGLFTYEKGPRRMARPLDCAACA